MSEEETPQESSSTVGDRLRTAREEKKLSREELASMLHLQLNIIDALENNRFDQLAAPTYTKGYIRSVSRHLDLDGDELIRLYETGSPSGTGPEITPQVSRPAQFSSTDKPVKIMTYLISLGLVLLLLIWWQSEFIVDTASNMGGSDTQSVDGPYPGGFDYTYPIVIHPDDPFYRAPSSESGSESAALQSADPVSDPPILNIDEGVESVMPAQSATDSSTRATGSTPTNTSVPQLTVDVSEEAWIEIRDANDEKLYLNLAKPGEVIEIEGDLPLSVVIGNAEGVKITWKGEAFDLAPHSSAGVARFTLEE